jgi:hypothetical protein
MGRFFTNVIVHQTGSSAVDHVIAAVDGMLQQQGWVKSIDDDAQLGRRVLIVARDSWTAVYDQGTEAQSDLLFEVAAKLGSSLQTTTIATMVHDSDELSMCIYDAGTAVSQIDCDARSSGMTEGGFARWQAVLPNMNQAKAVKALKKEYVLVEDKLQNLAEALSLPMNLLGTGFNYLSEVAPDDAHLLTYTPCVPICSALPQLVAISARDLEFDLHTSATFESTFQNYGAAFDGLDVLIHQENGMLVIENIRVIIGGPLIPDAPRVEEQHFAPPLNIQASRVTSFLRIASPRGWPVEHLRKLKLIGLDLWAKAAMPTLITVRVTFAAVAGGVGRLQLGIRPTSYPSMEMSLHDVECTMSDNKPSK